MISDSIQHTFNETAEVRLRPVVPDDERFVYQVYEGVRGAELAAMGWGETQRELFLKMQLKARDQSYPMYYAELSDSIILFGNQRAGRLIVSRSEEAIRLIDISLLPEYRGRGIGTALIKALFAEADETKRAVRLQVEKTNSQAQRLYDRLGFRAVGENQTHVQMEREKR